MSMTPACHVKQARVQTVRVGSKRPWLQPINDIMIMLCWLMALYIYAQQKHKQSSCYYVSPCRGDIWPTQCRSNTNWVCPSQLDRIPVLKRSDKRLLSSTEILSSCKVTPVTRKLHLLLQTHGHASITRYVLATRLKH